MRKVVLATTPLLLLSDPHHYLVLSSIITVNGLGSLAYRSNNLQTIKTASKSIVVASTIHTDASHFLMNHLILCLAWNNLIELFGLQNTLGLYFAGLNVTGYLSRKVFHGFPVGSSGAISTLIGAILWSQDIGPILAPAGAIGLGVVSIFSMTRKTIPPKVSQVDHFSHLVGVVLGSVCSNVIMIKGEDDY